jgi:NADPH2:quinone reductase
MAEYMIVNEKFAALKPSSVDVLQAACCPTSAVTALHVVREFANIQTGQRVLVIGGAGGVGSAVISLGMHQIAFTFKLLFHSF